MDGLKCQQSRLCSKRTCHKSPRYSIPSHPDPYTFTTDSDQTSLFPNMPMAQATTPDLGAALQILFRMSPKNNVALKHNLTSC